MERESSSVARELALIIGGQPHVSLDEAARIPGLAGLPPVRASVCSRLAGIKMLRMAEGARPELRRLSSREWGEIFARAATLFRRDDLPAYAGSGSFEEYVQLTSLSSGLPTARVRSA